MNLTTLLVVNAGVIFAMMVALWLVRLSRQDVSIVDIFWGLGFVLVAWITCLGTEEDYRYRAMREAHGPRFWWISLLLVFGLQGLVMAVVSIPVQVGQLSAQATGPLDALGILFWSVGFCFGAPAISSWLVSRSIRRIEAR